MGHKASRHQVANLEANARFRKGQAKLLPSAQVGSDMYYGSPQYRGHMQQFYLLHVQQSVAQNAYPPRVLDDSSTVYCLITRPARENLPEPTVLLVPVDPTAIIGGLVSIVQLVMYFVDRHERHKEETISRVLAQLHASASLTVTHAVKLQAQIAAADSLCLQVRRVRFKTLARATAVEGASKLEWRDRNMSQVGPDLSYDLGITMDTFVYIHKLQHQERPGQTLLVANIPDVQGSTPDDAECFKVRLDRLGVLSVERRTGFYIEDDWHPLVMTADCVLGYQPQPISTAQPAHNLSAAESRSADQQGDDDLHNAGMQGPPHFADSPLAGKTGSWVGLLSRLPFYRAYLSGRATERTTIFVPNIVVLALNAMCKQRRAGTAFFVRSGGALGVREETFAWLDDWVMDGSYQKGDHDLVVSVWVRGLFNLEVG